MIPSRKYAAVPLAALVFATAAGFSVTTELQGQANPPAGWSINHTLIVLDPAHGGPDSGAVLGDHLLEKDIALAIASRLRAALTANGFSVTATRDADVPDSLSTDQRAEMANRTHAMACIVLHATATGSGVHIYTSDLQPPGQDADPAVGFVPVPWNAAQSGFVRQSADLASGLGNALGKAHLAAIVGHSPMRPLDNLMCPAVAIEVAPLLVAGAGATPATDANYQQQVVNALAATLRAWRDSPDLLPRADANPGGSTAAQSKAAASAKAAGRTPAKVNTPATAAGSPPVSKRPQ